jgi:hypothetical protein
MTRLVINIWTASDIVAKPKKLSRRTLVNNATNGNAPIIEGLSQRSIDLLKLNLSLSNCGSGSVQLLYSLEIQKNSAGQCWVAKRGFPTSINRCT